MLLSPLVLGQVAFVEGPRECPSAAIVEQRVRGILGMKAEDVLEERAQLSTETDALRVVVRSKEGTLLGERLLKAEGTCEELEQVVAVVVATWISDVHPEFVAALPPGAAPAAVEPKTEDAGGETPLAPAPANPPAPSPPAPVATPAPARATPATRRHWELSAAGGADISDGKASALATLGVRWVPERSGLGAALAATAMTRRTEELSRGSVRYWRWPLVAGPVLRAPLGDARLDFHVGGALGWVHAQGRDFQEADTRDDLRAGGLVSVRGSYGPGRWRGFAEVSGVGWGKTEVFVDSGDDQPAKALPVLELFLAAGLAFTL